VQELARHTRLQKRPLLLLYPRRLEHAAAQVWHQAHQAPCGSGSSSAAAPPSQPPPPPPPPPRVSAPAFSRATRTCVAPHATTGW